MKRFIFVSHRNLLPVTGALAVALIGVVVGGAPAFARNAIVVEAPNPEDVVSRHISYDDLNLARPAGERALDHRVKYAINSLCSEVTDGLNSTTWLGYADTRKCSIRVWGQARPQIVLALERAREIAATGMSSIPAAAITFTLPK